MESKKQLAQTGSLISNSKRDAFDTFVNSTHIGDSLKSMLRLRPEPFYESSSSPVMNAPELRLSVHGTDDTISFKHQTLITLGRKDKSNGILPSLDLNLYNGAALGVSRRHAKISFNDGKFYIMDLDSSNGTKINEHPLISRQMTPIYDGDVISLGDFKLTVHL